MARPGPASLIRGMHDGVAAFRARLAARPDTEHEQAMVRLVNGVLFGLYLLPSMLHPGAAQAYWMHMVVWSAYMLAGVAILAAILNTTHVSRARRAAGAIADVGTLTWCLMQYGEPAAPLFVAYLWITLANGFRFGANYLLVCLALSIAGFSVVLTHSDFWVAHWRLGIGLMIALVALSIYIRSLVTKLFDAIARAEAANQAKRRFISVVSHEMRTPLNAIVGMVDLLRDTSLSREQADMLQTLRSSSRVMLGLVEDVLDFSKIEAGKVVLERTDFDLHALVNSTCRIVGAQAAAKGLEFVVSIMPDVPPAVRGDPHYLRQVLINLAGNAIKFTERGSVTVHVSAQAETETRVRLKFSIRDTGIGIAPEAQARVFESFTQADQSTTRRFGGTGLGTTIAKQLVGLMAGSIGLESAVGLGSTFWFEIELDKQREKVGFAGELANARVLLVGFPRTEKEGLTQSLSGWGATVIAVESIEEGVARMMADISLAEPYRSALIYAPRHDAKLADRFRRSAPNPPPPVILAVPREADVPRFEALSAGFAGVLELPFDKRQLFNVLHSVSVADEVLEGVVRLQDYATTRPGTERKLHVLVADDNPTNREVLRKILERGGHSVTMANDGESALEELERELPDIVLLDRNMPGLSGLETLQAMKLMMRAQERLPTAMLSADATPEAKREALEAGFDAFLAKPVEAVRLLEEIQVLARKSSGNRRVKAGPATAGNVTAREPAVLNAGTLRHLEDLSSSPAFMKKLVGVFLSDNAALVERVERSLASRDYREFRSLLHAIKGSSASMGTDRLTHLCGALSRLSDTELRLQTQRIHRQVSEELAAARADLERYLRETSKSAG